MAFYALMCS